jgi:hypothetical protein
MAIRLADRHQPKPCMPAWHFSGDPRTPYRLSDRPADRNEPAETHAFLSGWPSTLFGLLPRS